MFSEFLNGLQPLDLVVAGLLIFCGLFALLVAWTYRKRAKAGYEYLAQLPLEKE